MVLGVTLCGLICIVWFWRHHAEVRVTNEAGTVAQPADESLADLEGLGDEGLTEGPSGAGRTAVTAATLLEAATLTSVVVCGERRRPAVGVGVHVFVYGGGANAYRTTRYTDSDGRAEIRELPSGWARVALDRGGGEVKSLELTPRRHEQVEFHLSAAAAATVTVLWADYPMPGAEIWLAPSLSKIAQSYCGTTDGSGRAVIDGVSIYGELIAFHEHYLPSRWHSLGDGVRSGIELKLRDGPGARLQVNVRKSEGNQGVAGADVFIVPEGPVGSWPPAIRRATDLNGRLVSPALEPGKYRVEVRRAGFVSDYRTVELWTGKTSVVEVPIESGETLEGRVVDEDGSPLAGVSVHVSARNQGSVQSTFTAPGGQFAVKGIPVDVVDVSAHHPRWGKNVVQHTVTAAEENTIQIKLEQGDKPVIDGYLLTDAGEGLAGWLVGVATSEREGLWACYAETGPEGMFVIQGCPESDGRLEVKRPGSWQGQVVKRVEEVMVGAGPYVVEVPAEKMELVRIEGRVIGNGGSPVEGAFVDYRRPDVNEGARRELADDGGEFTLEGLLPGKYELSVGHRGVALEVVTIVAKPGEQVDCGVITVQSRIGRSSVVFRSSVGVQGSGLECRILVQGEWLVLPVREGVAKTPWLPLGGYAIRVTGDGILPEEHVITIEEGEVDAAVLVSPLR